MTRRNRYWASILYEESAPDGWEERLHEQHVPALVSPLHDLDVDGDGVLKKPHWHILVMYESLKSRDQAKELFDKIGSVGTEPVIAIKSYARYLCHLDDRDKAQYEMSDVKEFSGAYYREIIKDSHDKYATIKRIIDICKKNNITSYAEIMEYAKDNNDEIMFMTLADSPWVFVHYLKSRQWEREKGYKRHDFSSKDSY